VMVILQHLISAVSDILRKDGDTAVYVLQQLPREVSDIDLIVCRLVKISFSLK
jgi:hypothetical protein